MRTTTQIKQDLDRKVAEIRSYGDLTPEAKDRRIAEAYAKSEQEYREAVAEEERKIRERAEKAVFAYGHPFTASDVEKAQLRALQRDAYNGVYDSLYFLEPEQAREELERLLVRAERTGDTELAQAVYHIATGGASGAWRMPTWRSAHRKRSGGRSTSRPGRRPTPSSP
jgi:hypothetical protein